MRSRILAGIVLAALATAGAAAPALAAHGTWGSFAQSNEPNTRWDTSPFLPQRPNHAPVEKAYFNGLVIKSSVTPAVTSFELQADGNMIGPDAYYFAAVLGYWRDCNRDGYVGAKNVPTTWGNFAVYPRDLYTIDASLCPPGSAYNRVTAQSDPEAFIDELRWIGPCPATDPVDCNPNAPPVPGAKVCVNLGAGGALNCNAPGAIVIERPDTTPYRDPWDVIDNASRVWADWERPGGRHVYSQGLYSTPTIIGGKPPGTYADSDGTLFWVDLALGRTLSQGLGSAWNDKPNVGSCGAPGSEPEFLGGPDGTCGLWPLHQLRRVLNDSDTRVREDGEPTPLVGVFGDSTDANGDGNRCNDVIDQEIQQGTSRVYVGLDDVSPSVNPNVLVEGSIAGTLANVDRGVSQTSIGVNPDCDDYRTPGTQATLQLESNELDSELTHRLPTETLNFTADARYRTLAQLGFDWAPSDGAGATGGPTGFAPIIGPASAQSPSWTGRYGWTPRPPRHGWGSLSTAYATFYADVTSQGITNAGASPAIALPGGTQNRHTYGSDFCTTITTGPSNVNPANDWECSLSVWQAKLAKDVAGDPTWRGRPLLGDRYDFRDVDCFDNTVSESLAPDVKLTLSEGCGSDHGP